MRHVVIATACAVLLGAPASGSAQPGWFPLTVPGSIEQILGPAVQSGEPRLLRDMIRLFHDPEVALANRTGAEAFLDCLGDIQRLSTRWRAVQRAAGEVGLDAATRRGDGRQALEEFLELFDLRLVRHDSTYRVAPNREEAQQARERTERTQPNADDRTNRKPREPGRAICGVGNGWRSADVERRLNSGMVLAWDLPHFTVPLPLSPRIWLELLYDEESGTETIAAARAAEVAADLVGRLLTDSRAAQLYVGLAALDDPTLSWLQQHPRVLSRLFRERLNAFAQFGGALRVRDGEIRVPGGDGAVSFWEGLVDAPVTDPERFVDRLFSRSSGRVAHFYHLVSRLPERHQRFVLGAWRPDNRDRRRGLATLWRVLETLPLPAPRFADTDSRRLTEFNFGDRQNERICNVPSSEAIALTWQIATGRGSSRRALGARAWFACGPIQCTPTGQPNESLALDYVHSDRRGGRMLYACEVEAVRNFSQDAGQNRNTMSPARMYRLGYPLTGQDQDARQFIVR